MTLESFPNELLLELFEFLDAAELFRAFHGLNSRINSILFIQFRVYCVNFHTVLKYQVDFLAQHYLPLIANQIISFHFSNNYDESLPQTDFFFSSGLLLNQFINLRSLSLCYINDEETFRKMIVDCHQLPHLTHLKVIKCQLDYINSVDFSNHIWSLSKLTHCRLDMEDNFRMPTVVSLSIEYLSISCQYWRPGETVGLFQQTPYLRRFHMPLESLNINYNKKLRSVPSVTVLKLSDVYSLHGMLNILQVMPNLIHLTVNTHSIDFDGYQWEEIIDDYLPKLEVFNLKMYIQFRGEKNNEENVDNLVGSFRTRFWLEKHQWYIRYHHSSKNGYISILLYTLPYAFSDVDLNMLTVAYKSTCPQGDDYWSYDKVNHLYYNSSLITDCLSFIQFSNIRNLRIDLPFDKYFWQIVPTLHQLNSLTVLSAKENAQFDLQCLLDRAPCLYSLTIRSWPASQIPAVQNMNASVLRLDLRLNWRGSGSSFFSREECNTFIRSPLAMQCDELLIKIESRESILDLVNNMDNLRILHIEYDMLGNFRLFSRYHSHPPLDSNYDHNKTPSDILIKWLHDQLPTAYIVSEFEYIDGGMKPWICLKKLNIAAPPYVLT